MRFGHRRSRPGAAAAEGSGGGGGGGASAHEGDDEGRSGGSSSSSSRLAYACVEASGLLRFWEWGGSETGRWSWSYLNSCNICACREDPVGCRVLMARVVPEPDGSSEGKGGGRRHRLVWEQEDSGEGAGLGLAYTPATGPRPPRRVWSRRITFDLLEGGSAGQKQQQQQQQQQHQAMQEGGMSGFGRTARSEISLAFSACLLPGGVKTLLCSGLGAWMPTGTRVYFNQFATGRLLCMVLPDQFSAGDHGAWETGASVADGGYGLDDGDHEGGGSNVLPGEDGLEIEAGCDGDKIADAEQTRAFPPRSPGERGSANRRSSTSAAARRLFAVHETTGDLFLYDGHPDPTVRVLSPPPGAGGLKLREQCRLRPPPSPASSPVSFAARSNLAVFFGGGVCSAYDLCTGRLVGTAAVPRCTACAGRHRGPSSAGGVAVPPDPACACGRRRQRGLSARESGGIDYVSGVAAAAAASSPSLWVSETRGHLVGVLTATRVLRVRLPRAETCLAATLSPSSCRGKGRSACGGFLGGWGKGA